MITRTVAAAAAVLVVGLGGGLAIAQTTPPAGVDACYRTTTGALRVDTGTGCRAGEQAIRLGTGQLSTRHVTVEEAVAGGQYEEAQALCGPGEVVTGGGVSVAAIGLDYTVFQDAPIGTDGVEGWSGAVSRPYADPETQLEFWVTAICTPGVPAEEE